MDFKSSKKILGFLGFFQIFLDFFRFSRICKNISDYSDFLDFCRFSDFFRIFRIFRIFLIFSDFSDFFNFFGFFKFFRIFRIFLDFFGFFELTKIWFHPLPVRIEVHFPMWQRCTVPVIGESAETPRPGVCGRNTKPVAGDRLNAIGFHGPALWAAQKIFRTISIQDGERRVN